MNKIVLDGEKMTSKKKAHSYLKHKLDAKEYYGENLDALWDVLSTYDRNISIEFINIDKLMENLEDYGKSILTIFEDAQWENKNINVINKLNYRNIKSK